MLLKEREIFFNGLRSGIFLLILHDDSIFTPPKYYDRTSTSESLSKILSEDLQPTKSIQKKGIKVSPLNQMPQRLPIILEKVKFGNMAKSLLHEI